MIAKEYYKLAEPLFRQRILLLLLGGLAKNPELRQSRALGVFLLECLKEAVESSPEATKTILTIFTCLFSQVISTRSDILDLYTSIKYLKLSSKIVSLILPHVISKIIKIVDVAQLCDLMIIALYEMIEASTESSYELTLIILCEFNEKIIKMILGESKLMQLQPQEYRNNRCSDTAMEVCAVLNKVFFSSTEKPIIFASLTDPFSPL
jgi:hypothetical protein